MRDIEGRVPTFCPLCGGMMYGRSTQTFFSSGVCVNCFIQFVEGREDRWKSGWRPNEEEIQALTALGRGIGDGPI